MQHADKIVDRIIFLDGFPNMQVLDPLHIGQSVKEVLDCDLAAEYSARALYEEAATHCHAVKDYVTRDLFEKLMHDEETHIDFLETSSSSFPSSASSSTRSTTSASSTTAAIDGVCLAALAAVGHSIVCGTRRYWRRYCSAGRRRLGASDFVNQIVNLRLPHERRTPAFHSNSRAALQPAHGGNDR